jgi:hypothetical protein
VQGRRSDHNAGRRQKEVSRRDRPTAAWRQNGRVSFLIVDVSHYLWRSQDFQRWAGRHGVDMDDVVRFDINEDLGTMTVYEVQRTATGDLLLDYKTMKAALKPPREITLQGPVPK